MINTENKRKNECGKLCGECDALEDETDEEYIEKMIIEYVESLKTIVDTYETIDNFKQHQLEYWNEFIGM